MWLFHPDGFCSIVVDAQRPGNLLVRGRVKGDLERLFPGFRVEVTPNHDYRFRISVPREHVADRVAEAIEAIDYPNFKHECAADRQAPYLRVWSVMHELQLARAPKQRRAKPRRRLQARDVYTDADYYEWFAQQGDLQ